MNLDSKEGPILLVFTGPCKRIYMYYQKRKRKPRPILQQRIEWWETLKSRPLLLTVPPASPDTRSSGWHWLDGGKRIHLDRECQLPRIDKSSFNGYNFATSKSAKVDKNSNGRHWDSTERRRLRTDTRSFSLSNDEAEPWSCYYSLYEISSQVAGYNCSLE